MGEGQGPRSRLGPWEWWGVAGLLAALAEGALRLGAHAIEVSRGFTAAEWSIGLLVAAATVYGEGYRAIQGRWIPRVMKRAAELKSSSNSLLVKILAPFYLASLIGAPRRALLRAWLEVAAIVAAVLIVRRLPEPARGIIDGAVALALTWGTGALILSAIRFGTATDAAAGPDRDLAWAPASSLPDEAS